MSIGRARCLIILEWELRMDRIVRTSPYNSVSTPLSRSRVPWGVDFHHNPWATCRSSMGIPGIHQIRAGEEGIPDDDSDAMFDLARMMAPASLSLLT